MLEAARTAAWQDPDIHLGQRWWRAFKAAHNALAEARLGWLVLPHTIRLEWTC